MTSPDLNAGCFGAFFAKRRSTANGTSVQSFSRVTANSQTRTIAYENAANPKSAGEKKSISNFSPFCDYSSGKQKDWWLLEQEPLPSYSLKADDTNELTRNDIGNLIDHTLDKYDAQLRVLSLRIHDHPETMFEENFAHDLLTNFMAKQGFKVTKHYLGLQTAWRAEYSQGSGGRVIGINSEMDALKGLGHACGHNLIAISGVGVAIALKAALQARREVSAKIVLLGTPAEESGGGKVILLERGGYEGMDACMMCHPTVGIAHSTSIGSTNAMQAISVQYFGHSAHAGNAPWEGTNALDAAFLAYSSISMLRQQMKPDHRLHGIVEGKDWLPNVIPDYSKMRWIARAPTSEEVEVLVKRVVDCLRAAAIATGCEIDVKLDVAYFDLHQNSALAQYYTDIVGNRYGLLTLQDGSSASTDFGNVSYAFPALHPAFAIPTVPNGGNHTPGFAKASRTREAHNATMTVVRGLSLTGYRVLTDDEFFCKVKATFEHPKGA
ncbi:amidohydrolase [Pholiota conissans]|uniref:Amidohydrolase n=1 Tax=Pholiota conissans TaxID=109636 RepID=A0A9P6D3L0_9AGAR|nr:amidohydrolase [Pholiota conissans]